MRHRPQTIPVLCGGVGLSTLTHALNQGKALDSAPVDKAPSGAESGSTKAPELVYTADLYGGIIIDPSSLPVTRAPGPGLHPHLSPLPSHLPSSPLPSPPSSLLPLNQHHDALLRLVILYASQLQLLLFNTLWESLDCSRRILQVS